MLHSGCRVWLQELPEVRLLVLGRYLGLTDGRSLCWSGPGSRWVGRIEGTVMILGSPEARGQGFQRVNAALGA